MHEAFRARIIANDLDSIAVRIESLAAHPLYTEASEFVRKAKNDVLGAAADLHQREMAERFAKK
jgi:hypothetical protein